MSNQSSGRESAGDIGGRRTTGKADSFSEASDAAQGVAEKAKEAASNTASTITHHVKGLLDDQVGNGANMVGHFANSVKRAAEDLDQSAPQLAGVVRGVADRLKSYEDDLRNQSVDQLVRSASSYTRRQPAVVFGLAALVGFFAFRTFKSTPSDLHPGNQPRRAGQPPRGGEFHGS